MDRQEYKEMLELRKQISIAEDAMVAGYDIDFEEYEKQLNEFEGYVEKYKNDVDLMTAEEAEIFRLRYVLGLSFHRIMCVMYQSAKSESTARKKIERFFKKGLA